MRKFQKHPLSERPFNLDLSRRQDATADPVASCQEIDISPPGDLTAETPVVNDTGKVIQAVFAGGTDGTTYRLTYVWTTEGGQVDAETVEMEVSALAKDCAC